MSLLNFIQPIHSTRPTNSSTHIPYRLTPCAKTLGALLFILSSTATWASVDNAKKESDRGSWEQEQEWKRDLAKFAQLPEIVELAQQQQQQLPGIVKLMQQLELAQLLELAQRLLPEMVELAHMKLTRAQEQAQLKFVLAQKEKNQTGEEEAQAMAQELTLLQVELEQTPALAPMVILELSKQEEQGEAQEMVKLAEKRAQAAQTKKPTPSKATASKTPPKATATKPKAAPKLVPKPVPAIKDNPQIGSYIANQINAQKMFITDDLQHHQRETHYIDPITGEKKSTHMWLNTSSAKNRFNSGDKQLHTKSSRYAIQLGGPISKWSRGGNDQGLLGITAGFGRATSDSHAIESNRYARGTVEGYNLGLYHLWYANNDTQLGLYIDLLAQYSFFKNQVRTQGVGAFTNYKSYLFTTALETGYKVQLFEKEQARLFVQPNAKVSWQRASGLQHHKATDAQVTIEESNFVATKLGIRTALEFDVDTLSAKALQVSPSFEANWMHDNGNKGAWLSHTYVAPQGNRNIAELKLGIEGKINSNLQLWTHVGQQFGHDKYSETRATIGGNYHF
ncbi:Type V secretory pathway, adhesin AidA [Yersinia mollaretii ATCC 43969]|uniref:Type V secretory pathway, adhesin AidA n=1 Tax=Yersinia mollaretii (strain ATCC 43969 / DSM 18520 / CIP 103324 / CNY 7263 / WAIP 204) TaxID=349967 RepID=A0ABP2E9W6_YERMW|nr:autotransporter outer membrane beta-barrel domain-containing protein [Yersinia mollaretii]EEQ08663.1 Type V secretory pathway, adhesin AidA [Yersinia mollaretii ATCC 43969]